MNVTHQLIAQHATDGVPHAGEPVSIRIDQTLTQDATGTLVMLALEAMRLARVHTEVSVQYVDHNLMQADYKNSDDHLFLQSACRRFGLWFSRPGNGVSHPLHMQYFGKPGKTLLGSDSHTCAAGGLGMLAIGAGGLDVAMAMAGRPFRVRMPRVRGVRLRGELPDWVSAKDVVLEMLRRHGVRGAVGWAIEYFGPGLVALDVMDRHVIANMGAELGATTTVFPSDEQTRAYLESYGRGADWQPLAADGGEDVYDEVEDLDLGALVPLIAKPSSPGNVVPVREVAGQGVYQAYIGSSANPGFRDFAVSARMVKDRLIHGDVSFDINPSTRSLLEDLMASGDLQALIRSGARLHQAGCNGCIGMGQAPASGRNSVRTTPRNFPGRSGTKEDSVWLASPETASACALTGTITDPRDLGMPYPRVEPLRSPARDPRSFEPPPDAAAAATLQLVKGPNIGSMPQLDPPPDCLRAKVLLSVGDDISTDEILPAGARVLPFRSNIEKISDFVFEAIDAEFATRARVWAASFAVAAGNNYGQGSSREHAALAPRSLGLRVVVAQGFARIHRNNLINFGVLPIVSDEARRLEQGDEIQLDGLHALLADKSRTQLDVKVTGKASLGGRLDLSPREREVVRAGGLIRWASQSHSLG